MEYQIIVSLHILINSKLHKELLPEVEILSHLKTSQASEKENIYGSLSTGKIKKKIKIGKRLVHTIREEKNSRPKFPPSKKSFFTAHG